MASPMQPLRRQRAPALGGTMAFRRRLAGPFPFLLCLGAVPVLWLMTHLH